MKESKTAISDMEIGTEEKIKLAALRLFTQKGFNDTKTRDIAEEAGINVASLHYYFRSKDKLFQLVAEEAMQGFSTIRERIFSNKQPLHIKIREFVEQYIDFFRDNPFLPLFIVTESEKNSEKMLDMMSNSEAHREIQVHLDNLSKEGIIRPMSLFNFISNMVGMTIFPFIAKKVTCLETHTDEETFDAFLEERKKLIPRMIINDLYYTPPAE